MKSARPREQPRVLSGFVKRVLRTNSICDVGLAIIVINNSKVTLRENGLVEVKRVRLQSAVVNHVHAHGIGISPIVNFLHGGFPVQPGIWIYTNEFVNIAANNIMVVVDQFMGTTRYNFCHKTVIADALSGGIFYHRYRHAS